MSENMVLDYRNWDSLSSDEIGYTGDALNVSTIRHVNKNGQKFNILNVDARVDENGPTILTTTSHDYRTDTLLERRMSILATHTGSRVIVCELPGVTIDRDDPFHTDGAWQTPIQLLSAISGNFDPIATAQLDAIDAEVGFYDGQEIQLFGESLGAYCVTAMARSIATGAFSKRLKISRMDLVEPVNSYGNYRIGRQLSVLKHLATIEEQRRQSYLGENTLIGHGDVGAFETMSLDNKKIDRYLKSRQFPAVYLTGMGLRKGLDTALLQAMEDRTADGTGLYEADISVYRGKDSTVSKEEDIYELSEAIIRKGGHSRSIELRGGINDATPIGHHVLNSFGRLATYATMWNGKVA